MDNTVSQCRSYSDCIENVLHWIGEVYLDNIEEESLISELESLREHVFEFCHEVPQQCRGAGIVIALKRCDEIMVKIEQNDDMISKKSFKRRVISSLKRAKMFT